MTETDFERRSILRNAIGIGVASGAYGASFGALSVAAGFSVAQTAALSLLMFTGASQFALIAVLGAGGSALAGAVAAWLLGFRNALYGLTLSSLLQLRGWRRVAGAQIVIDETTAMAVARPSRAEARYAFVSTGVVLFVLWNTGTLLGAVASSALAEPRDLGLDAAVPAAFLALLAPRLRSGSQRRVAVVAALVALACVPFTSPGMPVLAAAAVAIAAGLRRRRDDTDKEPA